jgi:hypothetical protein
MPGAGFKRLAEYGKTKVDYLRYEAWKSVMRDYVCGRLAGPLPPVTSVIDDDYSERRNIEAQCGISAPGGGRPT